MASVPGCAPAPAAASSTPVVPGAAPRCRPEPQSRAGTARMTTWSRHRLRTGDDFRAVTRGGVRSARSHVVVRLSFLPEGGDAPRVGFVVSKKIGNAVVRNRVTRRLRAIVRPLLERLPAGSAVVIRALPGIEAQRDRKSTRLNSSHVATSYAVFCL